MFTMLIEDCEGAATVREFDSAADAITHTVGCLESLLSEYEGDMLLVKDTSAIVIDGAGMIVLCKLCHYDGVSQLESFTYAGERLPDVAPGVQYKTNPPVSDDVPVFWAAENDD